MKAATTSCFCVVPHNARREMSRPCGGSRRGRGDLRRRRAARGDAHRPERHSYGRAARSPGWLCAFAQVSGIERVRSRRPPHDLSGRLIDAFRAQPKLRAALPPAVQSGSESVRAPHAPRLHGGEYLERWRGPRARAARPSRPTSSWASPARRTRTRADDAPDRAGAFEEPVLVHPRAPEDRRRMREEEVGPVPHEVKIRRSRGCRAPARDSAGRRCPRSRDRGGVWSRALQVRRDPPLGRTPENRTVNFEGTRRPGPS